MSILFWTGAVTFGLAVLSNPVLAIKYATTAISVRGMGFICVKMTQSMNKIASEVIDFTAWAGCAGALVGIVGLAISGISNVGAFFQGIGDGWNSFWDTIIFWK